VVIAKFVGGIISYKGDNVKNILVSVQFDATIWPKKACSPKLLVETTNKALSSTFDQYYSKILKPLAKTHTNNLKCFM
jgi:hypothetical protein